MDHDKIWLLVSETFKPPMNRGLPVLSAYCHIKEFRMVIER